MILIRLVAAAALALPVLVHATDTRAQNGKTQVRKVEPIQKVGNLTGLPDEEKGDRARRALDAKAERLEREARKVMTTICRGC